MPKGKSIEFESVKFSAWELSKANWFSIKLMLDSLSDEEIEKIPSILDKPTLKEAAEKYGICDFIMRPTGRWVGYNIYIYCISGSIFKGETEEYNQTELFLDYYKNKHQ